MCKENCLRNISTQNLKSVLFIYYVLNIYVRIPLFEGLRVWFENNKQHHKDQGAQQTGWEKVGVKFKTELGYKIRAQQHSDTSKIECGTTTNLPKYHCPSKLSG